MKKKIKKVKKKSQKKVPPDSLVMKDEWAIYPADVFMAIFGFKRVKK